MQHFLDISTNAESLNFQNVHRHLSMSLANTCGGEALILDSLTLQAYKVGNNYLGLLTHYYSPRFQLGSNDVMKNTKIRLQEFLLI